MTRTPDEIKKGLDCCSDGNIICAGNCVFDDDIKLGYPDCVKLLMTNALALIQRLEAQIPRWISVEERLPEKGMVVLVMWHGEMAFARYTPHRLGWYNLDTRYDSPNAVSHWMPLPEPPKEEKP